MISLKLTVILVVILVVSVQCAVITPTHRKIGDLQNIRRYLVHLRDNRGCDAVIHSCDYNGACCDIHDACYHEHGCTAYSWLYTGMEEYEFTECAQCNYAVMECIALEHPGKSTCCARGDCGKPWNYSK